jgi:hypothetical protein
VAVEEHMSVLVEAPAALSTLSFHRYPDRLRLQSALVADLHRRTLARIYQSALRRSGAKVAATPHLEPPRQVVAVGVDSGTTTQAAESLPAVVAVVEASTALAQPRLAEAARLDRVIPAVTPTERTIKLLAQMAFSPAAAVVLQPREAMPHTSQAP